MKPYTSILMYMSVSYFLIHSNDLTDQVDLY